VQAEVERVIRQSIVTGNHFAGVHVEDWPAMARDVVALTQRGVLDPLVRTLEGLLEMRVQSILAESAAALRERTSASDGPGFFARGRLALATLRLLVRRLDADAKKQDTGAASSASGEPPEREIAYYLDMLQQHAVPRPGVVALFVRALMVGLGVAVVATAYWPQSGIASIFGVPLGLLAGSAAAALSALGLYGWHGPLHLWSCQRILASILTALDEHRRRQGGRILETLRKRWDDALRSALHADHRRAMDRLAAGGSPADEEASDVHMVPPTTIAETIAGYYSAYMAATEDLRERLARHDRDCSAYLQHLPRLDGPALQCPTIRRMLDGVVPIEDNQPPDHLRLAAWLLQNFRPLTLPQSSAEPLPEDSWVDWLRSCWDSVRSCARANVRTQLRTWNVHRLLSEVPVRDLLQLSAAQRERSLENSLHSPQAEEVDRARLRALAQEAVDKAQPQIPAVTMPEDGVYYVGTGESDDYLMMDPQLHARVDSAVVRTADGTFTGILRLGVGGISWSTLAHSRSYYGTLCATAHRELSARLEVQPIQLNGVLEGGGE
jgi:hypothetical protein